MQMAEIADQSDLFESVWVGDSLLGKPRMESMVLLAGVAGRDPVPLLCRTAAHTRALADDVDTLATALDPTDVAALRSARSLLFWLAGADRLPAKETEYVVKEIETIDALLRKALEK